MGCGSSKAVGVVGDTADHNRPAIKRPDDKARLVVSSLSTEECKGQARGVTYKKEVLTTNKNESDRFEERPALEARKSGFMSLIPLNAGPNYQGTPFDSGKSSKADFQSGFDLDKVSQDGSLFSDTDSGYLGKEYRNVITEKSDIDAVKKVEKDFKERLDLGKD